MDNVTAFAMGIFAAVIFDGLHYMIRDLIDSMREEREWSSSEWMSREEEA